MILLNGSIPSHGAGHDDAMPAGTPHVWARVDTDEQKYDSIHDTINTTRRGGGGIGWSIYEYNTDIWNAIVCWTIPRATCIRQCNSHCNSNRQCRYVQIGRNILLPNAIMQAQIQMCNGKHASYNGSNKKPESGAWDQHISIAFGTFDISIVQHGIANTKTSWKGGAGRKHNGHTHFIVIHWTHTSMQTSRARSSHHRRSSGRMRCYMRPRCNHEGAWHDASFMIRDEFMSHHEYWNLYRSGLVYEEVPHFDFILQIGQGWKYIGGPGLIALHPLCLLPRMKIYKYIYKHIPFPFQTSCWTRQKS